MVVYKVITYMIQYDYVLVSLHLRFRQNGDNIVSRVYNDDDNDVHVYNNYVSLIWCVMRFKMKVVVRFGRDLFCAVWLTVLVNFSPGYRSSVIEN